MPPSCFTRRPIQVEPEFADAHFNLAMLLETLGNAGRARDHWRRYLELDPESKWAEIIRQRLEESWGRASGVTAMA